MLELRTDCRTKLVCGVNNFFHTAVFENNFSVSEHFFGHVRLFQVVI